MAYKSATLGLSCILHGHEFNPLLPPVCAGEQSRRPASDSATVASVHGDDNRGVIAHDRVVGEVSGGVAAHGRVVGEVSMGVGACGRTAGTDKAGS